MERRNFLKALLAFVASLFGIIPDIKPKPRYGYAYCDPKWIGKSYILESSDLYIKREAYMLEFFAYEEIGKLIGDTGRLARANFS